MLKFFIYFFSAVALITGLALCLFGIYWMDQLNILPKAFIKDTWENAESNKSGIMFVFLGGVFFIWFGIYNIWYEYSNNKEEK